MTPKEIFINHWNGIKDPKSRDYTIKDNFLLQNGKKADIVIHLNDECIGFGNYLDELIFSPQKGERYYFHGKHGFIGCGTKSKVWFYFDKNNIIINDLKYNLPYDELMNDFDVFFIRLQSNYKYDLE